MTAAWWNAWDFTLNDRFQALTIKDTAWFSSNLHQGEKFSSPVDAFCFPISWCGPFFGEPHAASSWGIDLWQAWKCALAILKDIPRGSRDVLGCWVYHSSRWAISARHLWSLSDFTPFISRPFTHIYVYIHISWWQIGPEETRYFILLLVARSPTLYFHNW